MLLIDVIVTMITVYFKDEMTLFLELEKDIYNRWFWSIWYYSFYFLTTSIMGYLDSKLKCLDK